MIINIYIKNFNFLNKNRTNYYNITLCIYIYVKLQIFDLKIF